MTPYILIQRLQTSLTALCLLTISCASMAITPNESNYKFGLDVQGQRLNLYTGCQEGSVSCDDMLVVAPDITRWAFRDSPPTKRLASPLPVHTYSARTLHSTCKDGVSPCHFHGYGFSDDQIDGFIDPADNTLSLISKVSDARIKLSFDEQPRYLPLASQASLIDAIYQETDQEINDSYQATRREVAQLYGHETVAELKQDQIQWIVRRSKYCGADTRHRPRSQAEKVCFIQQNMARLHDYFLWID